MAQGSELAILILEPEVQTDNKLLTMFHILEKRLERLNRFYDDLQRANEPQENTEQLSQQLDETELKLVRVGNEMDKRRLRPFGFT